MKIIVVGEPDLSEAERTQVKKEVERILMILKLASAPSIPIKKPSFR